MPGAGLNIKDLRIKAAIRMTLCLDTSWTLFSTEVSWREAENPTDYCAAVTKSANDSAWDVKAHWLKSASILLGALRGGKEFAARHATILIMNSVFENYDRCDFRDSMASLILDGGAGRPHRILSSRDNSAEDSLRSFFQVLAYVNFRFLS